MCDVQRVMELIILSLFRCFDNFLAISLLFKFNKKVN